MRRYIILILTILLLSSPLYAATENILEGMGPKGIRGAVNLVSGFLEVPIQIYKGYDKGFEPIKNAVLSKTIGAVLGVFRGTIHGVGRMVWGALELGGFWTANPKDNEGVGIPFDAEYVWEDGEQYSIFKPSLGEGIKPVGTKLVRGLGDTLFGIAEVPGQTMLGANTGSGDALIGLGRGVWFWLSRELYGVVNLATCIVPNPKDNPGYAFNGEWPWTVLSEEMRPTK